MSSSSLDMRWCLVVAMTACGCGASQASSAVSPEINGNADGRTSLLVAPDLGERAEALAAQRPDLIPVVVVPRDDTKAREARQHVDDARQAYIAMEFESSLETIRGAVVLLESSARTLQDFASLAEALLLRGMAELALGLGEQARQSLLAAARLRPDRELDEGRYPPPVRELYAEARAALRAEPASSLTVATRPGGARLFLDGEDRGAAPQTLYATSGRHQLRVEAPGHAPRTLTVTFAPEGGQLEVELPRADRLAAARQVLERGGAADGQARDAWRQALGADAVVVVIPTAEGLAGTWVHLPSGATAEARATELGPLVSQLEDSAPAPPSEQPDAARRNEGLFARALLGLLLRGDELSQDREEPEPELAVEGGSLAADLELSLGGSLAPGVVFGGMLVLTLGGPAYDVEGDMDGEPRVGALGALGVFIAWYPTTAGGWNLYGSVGAASGELVPGGSALLEGRQLGGAALALGGGHEWWIADEWGLGVLVRLLGYRLTDGEGTHLSAGGLSAAGTLTFN